MADDDNQALRVRRRRTLTFKPFPDYPDATAQSQAAIRAWRDGKATAQQQLFLWEFVVKSLSGVTALPFVEGGEGAERQTTFNLGRQHVGYSLLNLADAPMPPEPLGKGSVPR